MTDAFVAEVVSQGLNNTWTVTPQIIENDGTTHPDIDVGIVEGITPTAGDLVLVLTTRNALDNEPIQRYFEASESCGRIVAILQTTTYKFTGDFKFIGDFTVDGDVSIEGDITVDGDSASITATNNISLDGNEIRLNGSSKSLVTYGELNSALQLLVTGINGALASKLNGVGAAGTLTLDISAAEASDLKTGGV